MTPTEGRVAKPEQRWECHRGTPTLTDVTSSEMYSSESSIDCII